MISAIFMIPEPKTDRERRDMRRFETTVNAMHKGRRRRQRRFQREMKRRFKRALQSHKTREGQEKACVAVLNEMLQASMTEMLSA